MILGRRGPLTRRGPPQTMWRHPDASRSAPCPPSPRPPPALRRPRSSDRNRHRWTWLGWCWPWWRRRPATRPRWSRCQWISRRTWGSIRSSAWRSCRECATGRLTCPSLTQRGWPRCARSARSWTSSAKLARRHPALLGTRCPLARRGPPLTRWGHLDASRSAPSPRPPPASKHPRSSDGNRSWSPRRGRRWRRQSSNAFGPSVSPRWPSS